MQVFALTFKIFRSLYARIVLLMKNVKTLFILAVDHVVLAEVDLSIVVDQVFFAELNEGSVVLVHMVQERLNLNATDFEIDGF